MALSFCPGAFWFQQVSVYDVECINPSNLTQEYLEQLARRGCANLVDIGIVITLEEGESVVVRTDGSKWAVFVAAEGNRVALQKTAVTVALGNRGGGPLSRF